MGYGSIRTISDANVRNCKSDIGELRPTVMCAPLLMICVCVISFLSLSLSLPLCRAGVPTVWEMIRKSALAKVESSGKVSRLIFGIALKVNMAYIHGDGIPIVHFLLSKLFDAIVFGKFHSLGAFHDGCDSPIHLTSGLVS